MHMVLYVFRKGRGMLFHTRDVLVRQRTQTINALRGHLAEFGVVAPQGSAHVDRLALAFQGPGSGLPGSVRELGTLPLDRIEDLDAKIDGLRRQLSGPLMTHLHLYRHDCRQIDRGPPQHKAPATPITCPRLSLPAASS